MRNKSEASTSNSTKAEQFQIEWPTDLEAVQPIMTVPVSKTRDAHVYKDTEVQSTPVGLVETDGYCVVFVIRTTGLEPKGDDDYYHHRNSGEFCRTLLDVKLTIQRYSAKVQPKVKTVTKKERVEIYPDDDE